MVNSTKLLCDTVQHLGPDVDGKHVGCRTGGGGGDGGCRRGTLALLGVLRALASFSFDSLADVLVQCDRSPLWIVLMDGFFFFGIPSS